MLWNQTRNISEGVLGDMREGTGELDVKSLLEHIERGARILAPIDPRVSPWDVPKLFELSRNQSVMLVEQIIKTKVRVAFMLRSDGTIALLRRDDAQPSDDTVPSGGSEPLPGLQPDHS
jgi:hypothetical protein